jgi:hypothetical protein
MIQSRFNAFVLSLWRARHRGFATLAGLALALIVAGCGSGGGGGQLSKSEYEQHLQTDAQKIKKAFGPLSTPPTSLSQLASNLKVGEAQLNQAADDLDSVKPPTNVEKDNEKLASGLHTFADELASFRKAAETQDPQRLKDTFTELQHSHALVNVRDATADLKKKGYKVSGLS